MAFEGGLIDEHCGGHQIGEILIGKYEVGTKTKSAYFDGNNFFDYLLI